ncbi:MAG: hypothetical protein IJR51_02065 [Clostridia bacterium]|nr:hypothetical protein [Clostridia bacterium]
MENKTKQRAILTRYDTAAICLGAFLLIFLAVTARYGFGVADEAFYYTIPQRLLNGDRLLVEEWNLTQFASLFSFIPYWLYVTVTGSTEGLILYMRYVFIAVDIVFYCYMYSKLRVYKTAGLISSFLFCAVLPEANYAIDYFTVSSMCIMFVCLTLFIDAKQPKSKPRLISTGAVFALGVLAEPFLIAIYIIYFTSFLVCQTSKKIKAGFRQQLSVLDPHNWFFFTLGSFIVFVAFITLLLSMGSLQMLPKTLPYLFSGVEYNESNLFDITKLFSALRTFGYTNFAGLIICILFAFHYHRSKQKNAKEKRLVFMASCLILTCCFIVSGLHIAKAHNSDEMVHMIIYHEFPILLISPVWYLLSDKKDHRLFIVWIAGFLFSVLVDISSTIMLAAGGKIAQVAGLIFFASCINEIKTDWAFEKNTKAAEQQKINNVKKHYQYAVAACTVVFILWQSFYIGAEGFYKAIEKNLSESEDRSFSTTIQSGPMKNLITTKKIAEIYEASLRDLKTITENSPDQPFYVLKLNPYLYLYADLPYGVFSAWDEDPLERHIAYWNMFEYKRPHTIYLFNYSFVFDAHDQLSIETQLAELREWADIEIIKKEAGYIIRILHVR